MIWELPTAALVVLNVAAWLLVHLGVAYAATQRPIERVDLDSWLLRARRFEDGGRFYERTLRITRWKGKLPDGAALFKKGFRKKSFAARDTAYLRRFALETGRSEIAHWVVISFAPLFFLWNPPWAGVAMIGYALLANAPCILAQRYNRHRLRRLLAQRGDRPASSLPALPRPVMSPVADGAAGARGVAGRPPGGC